MAPHALERMDARIMSAVRRSRPRQTPAQRATINLFPDDVDALDDRTLEATAAAQTAQDAATLARKEAERAADKAARKGPRTTALVILGDDPLAGPAAFGLAVLWPTAVGGPRLGVHGWMTPDRGRDAIAGWAHHLLGSFARDWVRDEGWRADVAAGPVFELAQQEAQAQLRKAKGEVALVVAAADDGPPADAATVRAALQRVRARATARAMETEPPAPMVAGFIYK